MFVFSYPYPCVLFPMAALLGRMSMILSMQAGPAAPFGPPDPGPPGPSYSPGIRSDSLIRPQSIRRNSTGGPRPGPLPPPTPPSARASAARFARFASSPIERRYLSSSAERFPCRPTLGCADLQTLPPWSLLPHVSVAKRFSDRNAATRLRNGAFSPASPPPDPATTDRGPTSTDGYVEQSPYEAFACTIAAHGPGDGVSVPPPPPPSASPVVPPRGPSTPCLPYSSSGTNLLLVGLTSGTVSPPVLS